MSVEMFMPGSARLIPNEACADTFSMDKKKPVDLANEPVDLYDDGMVDTGVLHEEDEEEGSEDGRSDQAGSR